MFLKMEAAQYRELELDALEARKAEIMEYSSSDAADMALVAEESRRCADEFERRNAEAALKRAAIAAVASGAGKVVDSMPGTGAQPEGEDPTSTEAYRRAFMDYLVRGRKSDEFRRVNALKRASENTLTSDVGAVIPTVLVNRILEKAESFGMILPLVTKTSFPAGMEIPIATIKPVATWVGEGQGSDRQKYEAKDKLVFTYHKLRCEVSMSMETSVMVLSAFESLFTERVAKAMVVAKEKAILYGTGSGQPKGILTETVPEGQTIEVDKADGPTWQTMVDAEAALPSEYENSVKWFMSKKTFMSFQRMVGKDGQPIARTNYGIGGKVERSLLGREVVCTADYVPNLTPDVKDGTVVAFMFDMSDYILNQTYDMGISKKQDWDTEDLLTKAVCSCDGKVAQAYSLVVLSAASAAAPGGTGQGDAGQGGTGQGDDTPKA